MDKIGAIWARVSTSAQSETSIPSQIERSRTKADSMGYVVPERYTLSTDRSSLDLKDDVMFSELYGLITKRKIQAVFLLDRDRLHAEPLERLSFLSLAKENGVQVIPCQGPELLDSDEGQLIEMVLAIGKKKSVLRAQLGSKQGLHDRVIRDRLPISFHKVYGYQWDKPNKTLIPDTNHQNVKLIFELLLDGKSYDAVTAELYNRGIPSPSGQLEWNKTGISNLVHNPIYAGRYYGLKKEAVLPKKRKTDTYGKSSMLVKPESEWVPIPEITIQDPPITWEQRQKILDQITSHMKLSKRHAKHDYLLRGFIFCHEHYGKNGRPRVYHGHPKRDTFYYCCPVPGCKSRYLPGAILEKDVKIRIALLLSTQNDSFYDNSAIAKNTAREAIERELTELQKKHVNLAKKQTRLQDDYYSERINTEVYRQLYDRYEFEGKGIENRRNGLLDQVLQLDRERDAINSLHDLWDKYKGVSFGLADARYEHYLLTNDQWREILNTLSVEIMPTTSQERDDCILNTCSPDGAVDTEEYEKLKNSKAFHPFCDVKIKIGVPLERTYINGAHGETPIALKEKLHDIVSANPEPG